MTRRAIALLLSVPAAVAAGAAPPFVAASTCALCHSRIPAPGDNRSAPVGPAILWRGSMMANSSRDPFWKAKVRVETALTPAAAAAIEDKCLRCHAPSQQYPLREAGSMRMRELDKAGEGVTCAICHQISSANLGREASFTGAFEINRNSEIYGPHQNPFSMPMLHHIGIAPVEAAHLTDAALCGSCHTVITPTLAADGRVTGEFVEQAPYLEWLASDFGRSGTTCQSCHVPVLRNDQGEPLSQYIAHMPPGRWFPPTRPRKPFGLHFFAGANVAMASALVKIEGADEAALQRTAAKSRDNLRSALALAVKPTMTRGRLRILVELRNRTGHKLPTGFPSRRIWLHVQALATDGTMIFESGACDPDRGTIRGEPPLEPHRSRISRPEQVMIYQAVTGDVAGRPTTSLLRTTSFLKDNRLLPAGFISGRDSRIVSIGTTGDSGFQPGSHRVEYEIAIPPRVVAGRVRVEAIYQSVDPAYLPDREANALRPATLATMMASVDVLLKPGK